MVMPSELQRMGLRPTGSGQLHAIASLLPANLLLEESILVREQEATSLLAEEYMKRFPEINFVIRDLLPSDLGLNGEWYETASTTDGAWETSVIAATSGTHELARDRIAVIYGLLDKSPYPIASAWRITAGASLNLQVSLERINDSEVNPTRTGYLRSPHAFHDQLPIKIEHYLKQIAGYTGVNGVLNVQPIGLIAERSNLNMAP